MVKLLKRAWMESEQMKSLYQLVVLFLLIGISMLLSSQLTGLLTQSVLSKNNSLALRYGLIFIIAESFVIILSYINNKFQTKVIQKMKSRFKSVTLEKVVNGSYEFSNELEQGDLLGRLEHDISSIVTASNMSATLIKSFVLLIVLSFGLLIMSPLLFIVFMIPTLLKIFIQIKISDTTMNLIIPWKGAIGSRNSMFQDLINNLGTIRIFQLYEQVNQWLEESTNQVRDTGINGLGRLNLIQSSLFILHLAPLFLVLILGSHLVSQGKLDVASLVSSLMMTQLAMDQVSGIVNQFTNIPHLMSSTQRIYPIWDAPEEHFGNQVGNTQPLIEYKNCSFAYVENKQIINHLDLVINEGEHIGIVGGSGSGKSTLLSLLLGLYVPTEGSVEVNRLAVQSWDKEALRAQFAVVSQNTYLFDDSIENNLRYAKEDASIDELNEVCQRVYLDKPLELVVGEKGSQLSGGERQRLSIARAVLSDRKIMVFDEATSALDLTTEKLVNEVFNNNFKDKTKIVVAHRLSSVINCDRIIVLDKGEIVEVGTHTELMQINNVYANLVADQIGEQNGK